jgi:hypothetical protein
MDSDQLNEWLRARYGITRSKLEPQHLLAVHAELSKVAVADAEAPVVVGPLSIDPENLGTTALHVRQWNPDENIAEEWPSN